MSERFYQREFQIVRQERDQALRKLEAAERERDELKRKMTRGPAALQEALAERDQARAALAEMQKVAAHWKGTADELAHEVLARLRALDTTAPPAQSPRVRCPVYERHCPEHGFVHGAEAEELRQGLEEFLAGMSSEDVADTADIGTVLQALLDKTDARDSLAYREAQEKKSAEART